MTFLEYQVPWLVTRVLGIGRRFGVTILTRLRVSDAISVRDSGQQYWVVNLVNGIGWSTILGGQFWSTVLGGESGQRYWVVKSVNGIGFQRVKHNPHANDRMCGYYYPAYNPFRVGGTPKTK